MRAFFQQINTNKTAFWLLLAVFCLLLRWIFGLWAGLCELLYARGLFQLIRLLVDYSLGWLPFASVYLLFIWLCWSAGKRLFIFIKTYQKGKKLAYALNFLAGLLRLAAQIVCAFLLLWGFNYARVPLEEQIGLNLQPLSVERLRQEAIWVQNQCAQTRAAIPQSGDSALSELHFNFDMETELRDCLSGQLRDWNFPTWGCPRARWLRPNGLLLGFGATGVYIPFSAEAHLENALHCSQQPFTLAHELGHAYGWGDEAVCNFLGYVACMRSERAAVRYSGYLSYWRYVMGELKSLDYDFYKNLRQQIPQGMDQDLKATYRIYEQYPNFFPKAQQAAYNAYLKSQGVKEGIQSYNRMVILVAAWR